MPAPSATDPDVIPRVTEEVFFTTPGSLPRGRHALPRDQVEAAQRERLLIAMTELLAAKGYRGFGAGDVTRRAGVSLDAFYGCFENKEACVFAGYDRFIEVLLREMVERAATLHNLPADFSSRLVSAYFDTLGQDLVVARAYQVEIDALGYVARERRRNALALFADYFKARVAETDPAVDEAIPDETYLGVVYAARQLASDALDQEGKPDFARLSERLRRWTADVFRPR